MGSHSKFQQLSITLSPDAELELLLCGLPEIDLGDWQANTVYKDPYCASHTVVIWFWETLHTFTEEQKARLLQFVTGTSRVPVTGFARLQGNDGKEAPFTLAPIDVELSIFPRSHTCFNRLELPMYFSKEDLEKYITTAIQMELTFGLE